MKFNLTLTFNPIGDQIALAKVADEMGMHSVNLGDGLFFYETTSVKYTYTATGDRYWNARTGFLDPFCAISHLGAVTKNVRFLVNVLKLPCRQPMLVAKQAGTAAYLCQDRMSLGVGLSVWPEDFSINGTDMKTRGERCSEMIEILRKALTGEVFDYKGKFYDIPPLSINPVPNKPMPILIGGTASAALKRAAKLCDGFVSPNVKSPEIEKLIKEINGYRKEFGTDNKPFEMISVATDIYDLDGHKRLRDMGVTEACVMPWMYMGGKFSSPLQFKIDALNRFNDEVMSKMD
jgi:alkanesulfonate monooxygenase SsuD/methylene tetrahydromethanopterin reductase-like flavin-dependent oxidoreductase (luciferase family)